MSVRFSTKRRAGRSMSSGTASACPRPLRAARSDSYEVVAVREPLKGETATEVKLPGRAIGGLRHHPNGLQPALAGTFHQSQHETAPDALPPVEHRQQIDRQPVRIFAEAAEIGLMPGDGHL